jgi:hypothetical protein
VILRRLILALAAATAFAASAAVCIVALAFALYALVEPYVGRAGAAAIVAGSAALLLAIGGLSIGLAAGRKRPKIAAGTPPKAVERVFAFVRQKPVVAMAAALGAGFMAVRNPRYLGALVRSFIEGREPGRR